MAWHFTKCKWFKMTSTVMYNCRTAGSCCPCVSSNWRHLKYASTGGHVTWFQPSKSHALMTCPFFCVFFSSLGTPGCPPKWNARFTAASWLFTCSSLQSLSLCGSCRAEHWSSFHVKLSVFLSTRYLSSVFQCLPQISFFRPFKIMVLSAFTQQQIKHNKKFSQTFS